MQLDDQVQQSLCEGLRQLAAGGMVLTPPPTVSFDLRGRSAGQARPLENRIRLNRGLLQSQPEAFTVDTVWHELCHLAVWARYGARAKPHGPQWQALMRSLGLEPRRCHDAPCEPVRRQRRHRYHCACREHQISTTRHKRAQRGVAYRCCHCHQILRLQVAAAAGPAAQ